MFLKKTKRANGRITLSAVQSYRDPKTRKSKQRSVKTFGYIDELEKKFPDPVAHFTEVVKEMNTKRLAEKGPQTITIHPLQKTDKHAPTCKFSGDAVVIAYYNALGIEIALRSMMRKSKTKFDINSLLRLLVSERLLSPGSKLAALKNADKHFFKCDFSEADVYRGLDELARACKPVVAKMNRSIEQAKIRDLKCGYYDCTNYYFESEGDEFRRKGVCKEHRPNPIVQMGLMQDSNGIPVDFHIFSGNTHDSDTLLDALPEAKQAAKMGRIVTVADKGMNCARNIIATVGAGDGFVFSQSIRATKSKRKLRNWVISDEGYEVFESGDFKMKARQDIKTIKVSKKDSHDGKEHAIDIEVLVVAFWSRKYAEHARYKREKVLEKSYQLISNPGQYTRATHYGAAKYVKNIEFDAKTGEVISNPKAPILDEEAIAADAACDGFYCIVTSETDWSPSRVIDTYRELWKIEETFKITKSYLKTRPVFVWTPDHIKAHFLTCYIALTIERIIEHALGNKYSAGEILNDMRKQEYVHAEDDWWLSKHRSDLSDELFALMGEETPCKWMSTSALKSLFAKNKKVRFSPCDTTKNIQKN